MEEHLDAHQAGVEGETRVPVEEEDWKWQWLDLMGLLETKPLSQVVGTLLGRKGELRFNELFWVLILSLNGLVTNLVASKIHNKEGRFLKGSLGIPFPISFLLKYPGDDVETDPVDRVPRPTLTWTPGPTHLFTVYTRSP